MYSFNRWMNYVTEFLSYYRNFLYPRTFLGHSLLCKGLNWNSSSLNQEDTPGLGDRCEIGSVL